MKNLLLLAFLIVQSCNTETNEHAGHWSYQGETGPEHWDEIEQQSDCNGVLQSPINIIDLDAVNDNTLDTLHIHYSNKTKINDVRNNGHTIQYDFDKGDYITLEDIRYDLAQIHFHEPAEHTLNGVRFPLEMHMVHLGPGNKIAVFAILAEEGAPSAPFDFLENYLPIQAGEKKQINTHFDLMQILPESKAYYTYEGSLTTPPCTEGVRWFVLKNPITISVGQVELLQKIMPLNNYRQTQPLNGRKIRCLKTILSGLKSE
ncbi:MAG: carbonic anhydrase family protein [Saprospiraceae bacterium]